MFPVGKKYTSKGFLIAAPVVLLALTELAIFFIISFGHIQVSMWMAVVVVLILSAIAIAGVLYLYNRMVKPLQLAKVALNNYVVTQKIPELPTHTTDEAGLLLKKIHATITQLDALNVEKSDMIDLLSHDLRSPVGRIISLSNLIKHDPDGDISLYADYINNECKGLLRMLENILLMLKEDNHVLGMSNVSLEKIITETVSFFDFSLAEKKILLDIDIDPKVVIHVQPDLFTQAVRNILGNAIKFSPEGKTIHLTGKQEMEKISLSIRDEGLGLKPGDAEQIFDRFTKAGKRGTKGEASVGLGLYLSKKIVEKHAGELVAESMGVNKGASFTIILHRLITKKPDKMISKDIFEPTFIHAANSKPLYNKSQLPG
jgi:signal transduction histidine kinase